MIQPRYRTIDGATVCEECGVQVIITKAHTLFHQSLFTMHERVFPLVEVDAADLLPEAREIPIRRLPPEEVLARIAASDLAPAIKAVMTEAAMSAPFRPRQ